MTRRFVGLRTLYVFVCCVVLALLLPMGTVAGKHPPFFFFVITDPQLGMYDHDQDLSRESENLQKLVAIANRLHPAFIVNCGDLVNRPGDSREIQQYQHIMSGLDPHIPVYNVPGNHDVRNQPTPESLAAYRSAFGRDYYTFQYQGLEGVVLNTSLIKYPELAPRESAEQSAWLETTLAQAKNKDVIVFQHIPWFLREPDEADDYSNLPLSQRKDYLHRFESAGIRYIFAGHLHENAFGSEGKIQMRTVSALGKPLGKTPSGFGVVIVDGHNVKFTYYPISAPPTELPM